jgi:hypothetical protein
MTNDLDERLTAELGGTAYRLPPPPLADIHRRAGRRRRNRLARRGAGAAALVTVAAVAVAGFPRGDDVPVTPETHRSPRAVRSMACSGSHDLAPGDLGTVARLPRREPAGLPLSYTQRGRETGACQDVELTAWHQAPGTHRIDRSLRVGVMAYADEPGERCDRFDGGGQQPGQCRRLTVAGEPRWVLRTTDVGQGIVWAEDGRLWALSGYGFDAAAFEAAVADLRIEDGTVVPASLPAGFDAWVAPDDVPTESLQFVASYGGDPGVPSSVTFVASDTPLSDPFALLPGTRYPSPGARLTDVDVDGRPGVWTEESRTRTLRWRGGDGVSLSLEGASLTLSDALAAARSVRPLAADDARLRCSTPRPAGCG